MKSLISYLGCGRLYIKPTLVEFRVTKILDLDEKILPEGLRPTFSLFCSDIHQNKENFFNKYLLQGAKLKNYQDFIKVFTLVKEKAHFKPEGLAQIKQIKSGMNTLRASLSKLSGGR
jgi:hypothetical protein